MSEDKKKKRKRKTENSQFENAPKKKSWVNPKMITETYEELVEQMEIIREKMRILKKKERKRKVSLQKMLSNSVIVGKIFSYLAPTDIKSLSLVAGSAGIVYSTVLLSTPTTPTGMPPRRTRPTMTV